jgi:hypothetical protein
MRRNDRCLINCGELESIDMSVAQLFCSSDVDTNMIVLFATRSILISVGRLCGQRTNISPLPLVLHSTETYEDTSFFQWNTSMSSHLGSNVD